MFLTMPVRDMPSSSTSSVCFFFSSRSSSRTARRDSTTLPRLRFSLITLARTVWPSMEARFLTGRRSTWEPGRKARTPTSTARPPLTTSITRPSTGTPFSCAREIASQTLILSALSLERTISPSLSSFASRKTSMTSPTFGGRPRNSSIGIEPSLLYPTSTRTWVSRTWTTCPDTTSPSSNSANASRYQSSIRSPAGSWSPPVPPRVLFGMSFSAIPAVPPCIVCPILELSDCRHHLSAGDRVLLFVSANRPLEDERLAEVNAHLRQARYLAPPWPRLPAAPDERRHDLRTAQHGQHPRARLAVSQHALVTPGALGEHQERAPLVQELERRPQRRRIVALPAHGARVEGVNEGPEQRDVEQLRLRHEVQ